ncbi:MAG: hypothetical protein HQL87_13410 [Magnetococcales bacterium]|nr:hypothetical protein [Magnetococcales bacterium]
MTEGYQRANGNAEEWLFVDINWATHKVKKGCPRQEPGALRLLELACADLSGGVPDSEKTVESGNHHR